MAHEILMPQLGLTMEEGTVSLWVKHVGDPVKVGDVILEITTDKLTNEITSEYDGVLLKIVAEEGEDIPVKGLLGYIGQEGEAIDVDNTTEIKSPDAFVESAPIVPGTIDDPLPDRTEGMRIRISPLAKKTALKMGIDYTGITGSGPSGRIIQKDILRASEKKTVPEKVMAKSNVLEMMDGDCIVKLSGMRKVVAQRMLQSHTEIPPVTQNTKVDVTKLMKFRKQLLEECGKKYSVNDLVLMATAKTLRNHPEILVSYDDGQIIQRAHVNLGMAVALDAGLIVPVIRDADELSLSQLSEKAKDLATRAKENKLLPDEYKGSTFSVSNLGMFGIETFTPIVNQPDAAILGVCAISDELVMDDAGNISKHQFMRLSFTYDHRLIDGAVAAKYVMDLRDMLQNPLNIIL